MAAARPCRSFIRGAGPAAVGAGTRVGGAGAAAALSAVLTASGEAPAAPQLAGGKEGKAEGCAPAGGWESGGGGGAGGFPLGLKRVGRSIGFLPVISGSFLKSRGLVARWSPGICTVADNSEYLQPGLPFLLPCRKLLLLK